MAPVDYLRQRLTRPGALRGGVAALCLLTAIPLLRADHSEASEYQVKAAFLMNFTKFVEWPAGAFRDASQPITICVYGDDPFGAALDQVVEGESVSGRRLAVDRLRRPPAPKTCQVLFISRSERDAPAIVAAAGPGVLTVSDQDNFLHDGGVIAFVLQARHVRFDISLRAAAKASLVISSRLLNVARAVVR
jgi:hypothetical protein